MASQISNDRYQRPLRSLEIWLGLGIGQRQLGHPDGWSDPRFGTRPTLGTDPGREVERRLALGCSMLLDRMCPRGGWNAGNSVVYGVALAPHIDATAIALAGLRSYYHLPEVRQSLSWLLAADCSSAFSLACKILALQSYLDVRSDTRPAIEVAQAKLAVLTQEPAQIADNSTLALSILALSGNPNPFALEVAA